MEPAVHSGRFRLIWNCRFPNGEITCQFPPQKPPASSPPAFTTTGFLRLLTLLNQLQFPIRVGIPPPQFPIPAPSIEVIFKPLQPLHAHTSAHNRSPTETLLPLTRQKHKLAAAFIVAKTGHARLGRQLVHEAEQVGSSQKSFLTSFAPQGFQHAKGKR